MIKKWISKWFGFEKEIKALRIKNELYKKEIKSQEKIIQTKHEKIRFLESKIVTLKKRLNQSYLLANRFKEQSKE